LIRVLVAVSSPVLRAGLESLLAQESAIEITGSEPEVVLTDNAETSEQAPVVLLSDDARFEDVRAPIRAILPRDVSPAELTAAIQAVAAGLIVVHPGSLHGATDTGPLTPREIEILRMLAEGLPNKSIAWKLEISEHTVKFHVASILGKLGASSRTEAVTLGLRRGLIFL
jgi:DNA-binding NarL/FixJ family response regulator